MAKTILPLEFDTRMVEWNLKHSVITKDQLKTFLGGLPDEADNAQTVDIEDDQETSDDQPV